VNEDSFDSSQEDVERHASAACEALQSFLDCAGEARKLLCGRVEERVHDDVVGEAIGDTSSPSTKSRRITASTTWTSTRSR
jgi:hypothetical protein